MRNPALVRGVVNAGGDIQQVAQLERATPMGHSRRDLEAGGVVVPHQELHQLTLGWRSPAGVVQRDLERADDIPPVGLLLVYVPGLRRAGVHERMAPLAELVEETIRLANHLAKETALVCMSDKLLDDNTVDHRSQIIAPGSRRWRGQNPGPGNTPASIRRRLPRSHRQCRTRSGHGRDTSCSHR